MTTNKEAYQEKMRAQLKEWEAEMDRLKAKMENARADAQIEYSRQMDQVKAKYDQAYEKFKEFQQSSDDAWQDMKSGVERAWKEMSEAMSSASAKLQK